MNPRRVFAVTLLITELSSELLAYAVTCVQSSQWTTNSNSRRYDFRVNTSSFDNIIPSIGGDNAKYAAIAAGSTWNEQANAATFRYTGTTTETTASCNNHFSVVLARTENSDSSASIVALCPDPDTGEYTQFRVNIWLNDLSGNPRTFGVGAIAAGQIDLVSLITHEFGHSVGLSHPTDGTIAIMSGYGYTGNRKFRDLYAWDMECSRVSGGDRTRNTFYKMVTSGSIGNETSLSANGLSHAAASKTFVGGVGQKNWTGKSQNNSIWANSITNPILTTLTANSNIGIGPVAAIWLEDTSYDRVFWSTHNEYDADGSEVWDGTGSHRVLEQYTNNKFSTSSTFRLRHCGTMTSWMTCGTTQFVQSALPISTSYDLRISKTVIAWVNQDRDVDAGDFPNHEILVAHETINNYTLPTPNDFYLESAVSPGLACHINSVYGGYDCILAWVDWNDPLYRVKITTFKTTGIGSFHHSITKGTTYYLGDTYSTRRTSNRVTAWRHNFAWWIAFRISYANQECYVYSSSDASTNSWNFEGSIGLCDEGPSAISNEYDSNMIVYMK